jgi:hypothetical protein
MMGITITIEAHTLREAAMMVAGLDRDSIKTTVSGTTVSDGKVEGLRDIIDLSKSMSCLTTDAECAVFINALGGCQLAKYLDRKLGEAERAAEHATYKSLGHVEPWSAGTEAINTERMRQVTEEGWTAEHDNMHATGELAAAAICYARLAVWKGAPILMPSGWPWSPDWWKPSTPKHNLEKAGALLAAEWDRLDRLEHSGDETLEVPEFQEVDPEFQEVEAAIGDGLVPDGMPADPSATPSVELRMPPPGGHRYHTVGKDGVQRDITDEVRAVAAKGNGE